MVKKETGVMVDNWLIEEMLFPATFGAEISSSASEKLITAIVLWDKVSYPRNHRSVWNKDNFLLADILTPIEDWNEDNQIVSPLIPSLDKKTHNEDIQNLFEPYSEIVKTGALHYMALSAKNHCDYLPCKSREKYLQKQLGVKQFGDLLSKMKAQNLINTEIKEQITETFQKFLEGQSFYVEAPNLADYIIGQTAPDISPIEHACELRKEKPVVAYREYIENLSKAFRDDDYLEFAYLQGLGKEVVEDVLTLEKGKIKGFNIKINPGFTFSVETRSGTIEITISLSGVSISAGSDKRTLQKRNLAFLTNLTSYAATHSHIKD